MKDYLSYWGKARPRPDAAHPWHPVAYHSLDVAACGRALLERNHLWRNRLSAPLQLGDEKFLAFATFLLALHDIGKFSKPFQSKSPEGWPSDQLGAWEDYAGGGEPRHDSAGWWLWRNKIEALFSDRFIGIDEYKFDPLIRAVTGHHGTPPEEEPRGCTDPKIGPACIAAAKAYATDAAELFLAADVDLTPVADTQIASTSWALAGLTTLADWIGSNQRWFGYVEPGRPLAQYWEEIAVPLAQNAVAKAALETKRCAPTVSYGDFFEFQGHETFTPSPMQCKVQEIPLADGPGLYLIEDITGSGKTEAALMLAHRLMAAGKADGLFFALPTQATANAMYERLEKAYGALFESEAKPSLILAHGARDLSAKFTASILDGFSAFGEIYGDTADDSDMTASAHCGAWIADDRRLAFLADVGAGTIDQVLLAVLPSRHQSLRLAGLMRRVLILDEIHAYDAYMQKEIETLLTFHRALGGSAILLSATLPHDMKSRLCAAYDEAPQAPDAEACAPQDVPYPLVTLASPAGRETFPTEPRKGSVREVPVRFLASPEEALERVRAAAKDGQAVLYIRNTVNDAIGAFEALGGGIENLSLFHARFAFCDRLRQEQKTIATFGKFSTPEDRRGQVLIATQLVEQSLDLDFDLVVSDLAPIDLLIQRAGRLWRHERKERLGECELLMVSPVPVAKAEKNWIAAALPGTAAVYGDHARLWLTAKSLQQSGAIRSPGDLRPLIESVYGVDAEHNIPAALMETFLKIQGQQGADRGLGTMNTLTLSAGYARDGGLWGGDERTPTRLGEETTTFRLARLADGRLHPWAAGQEYGEGDARHLWRLSEVSLRSSLADGDIIPAQFASQEKEIRDGWGKWQDDKKLLILRPGETPSQWQGHVRCREKTKAVAYSPLIGLAVG